MTHPYNDAERFEEIAQVYLGGYSWGIACVWRDKTGGYSWGIACVWRDKTTGRLYGDTDSGCSCYGPFEDACAGLGDLVEVAHERDAAALLDGVSGEDEPEPSTTERQDFVRAVQVALAV